MSPATSAGSPRAHPRFGVTDALLISMAFIWGVNFSVLKYGATALPPVVFNGVRIALASVALLAIAGLWRKRSAPITWRDVLLLGTLGLIGHGLYQFLFIEGVARTRAGNAALLIAAAPAFIALFGRLFRVERVALRGWMGIFLSIAGIGLVAFGSASRPAVDASLLGDGLVLAAAVCWALFTVLAKPLTRRMSDIDITAWSMALGALPLMLLAAPGAAEVQWSTVPPLAYGAIVYSGLGGLVIAYLFWFRGVRLLGPARTAMYANLQPVIALLVAWGAVGEVPTSWQTVGAATIIGGVLLTRS